MDERSTKERTCDEMFSGGGLVDDGTGPEQFLLSELRAKIKAAVVEGFTPLLSDPSGQLDDYLAEQGAEIIDAKRLVVETGLGRRTWDDALETARAHTVKAMKIGNTLVISMQQAAPDFRGRLSGDYSFPLELLERAGKSFVGRTTGANRLFSVDDTRETGGVAECDPDFQVVLTSHFKPTEMRAFLFKQPMFPKRSQFRILELMPDPDHLAMPSSDQHRSLTEQKGGG